MKRILRSTILACACGAFFLANTHAANQPGYVDFGKFTPGTGDFVEVNISSNLISMVTRLAKDEPEIFDVLKGLKAIRVNVIGLNDENREDMQKRVASVRANLTGNGWERVVTAIEDKQDVGVYINLRGDEAVEGVVVTVLEGDHEAIFVNIVGEISPEKLATVGERFNIEPLKHLPKVHKESSVE